MKYYGKSKEVCNNIVKMFQENNLPDKLATIFVNRKDNIPSSKWSFLNKLVQIMNNTNDARTMKQWNNVGRKVKKGSRSFTILGPLFKTLPKEEDGEINYIKVLYGFKGIPVFRFEDTEIQDKELWDKKSGIDHEENERLQNLPLREVAEKWNLDITSFNAKGCNMLGYYQHGKTIAIGVENLSTWCHELVHAADDKNGTIVKCMGQNVENEIVAEIGGNVLLKTIGYDDDVDLGGAWEYVKSYAGNDEKKTIKKVTQLIDRICKCVNIILEESDIIIKKGKINGKEL